MNEGKIYRVLAFIDQLSEWTGKATSYLVLLLMAAISYEERSRASLHREAGDVNAVLLKSETLVKLAAPEPASS